MELYDELLKLKDEKYRVFHSSLVPGMNNMIGVRMPDIKKIAKRIADKDYKAYLKTAKYDHYEEKMIAGLVIGFAKADFEELKPYIKDFIPRIDNWAICDGFCTYLKIAKKYPKEMWDFIEPYFSSDEVYEIRFAVVMSFKYFCDEFHKDKILKYYKKIDNDDYYVKMAVAWGIAEFYNKFKEDIYTLLSSSELCDDTHKMAIQKIVDSLRVTPKEKEEIKKLKRKKGAN